MKKKKGRVETDKLSISLPKPMAAWLRQAADNDTDIGNVSAVIRRLLLPSMPRSEHRDVVAAKTISSDASKEEKHNRLGFHARHTKDRYGICSNATS